MEIKNIHIFYGTRPEFIKLAPLMYEIKRDKRFICKIIHTGQHKHLTHDLEKLFGVFPDITFDVMEPGQHLNHLLTKIVNLTHSLFQKDRPDIALVQGDTTTVLGVSLAAFYQRIKIGHVEAGLRTFNLQEPFPEEFNRKITSVCANYHFAPTPRAKQNLINEGIDERSVFVTGNTVVDAIQWIIRQKGFVPKVTNTRKIFVTAHRRENFGVGLENICKAIKLLSTKMPDIQFIWPLHPNPEVGNLVKAQLAGQPNVNLIDPLPYDQLIFHLLNAKLIWSDSGGIQEEVPTLKKPILILRNVTERPEVVESGFGALVGTDPELIVSHSLEILQNESTYSKMTSGANPFGNGTTSNQIMDICANV